MIFNTKQKMKYFFVLFISILIIQNSVAPPVTKNKTESENEVEEKEELADVMEYHRYLKEVVQTLESDPDFRAKLEKIDNNVLRSGEIANELELVSHNVRSKLDELKRRELERLNGIAKKMYELKNGLDTDHMKIAEHIDHTNPHTFEIDDWKKLIAKTTKDIQEADKRRREEFKNYEMKKRFEQEAKMKNMSDEDKKKFEYQLHDTNKKHEEHEPLHHPGSKKQLEEVWEKQDHMVNQQFNPRTFFYLHDVDENGVWDQNEIKSLFLKELDKLYYKGNAKNDLVERAEEMERMSEHVINEFDLNKDGLVSYEEFLKESQKVEFEQDPGWESLDEQQIYSDQEYEEYKRQKAKEIESTIARGMSQEYHPAGQPQTGHQQFPPHPNNVQHQGYMQQQPQYQHQVPQQQHYSQQDQFVNQPSSQQGQYNHMPSQQVPPQQGHYQQVPPQQGQYQQVPPHNGQYANQQQFHPNQQAPLSNNLNQIPQQNTYPAQNQQVLNDQNKIPQQQQPPVIPNTNQLSQQQLHPPAGQQQNQQQQTVNNLNKPQQV